MRKDNPTKLLERFCVSKTCRIKALKSEIEDNCYVTPRRIDTIEFTCSLGDKIDARRAETRKQVHFQTEKILKPYFGNIEIISNVGSTLIAKDKNSYVFVVVEKRVKNLVVGIQLKGRFYNVGRYKGIDTMAYTQEILRDLDDMFEMPRLDERLVWKIKQLDICQDFKGYKFNKLVKNYHYPNPKEPDSRSKNVVYIDSLLNFNYGNTKDLNSIETVYINLKKKKGRLASVSLKIYNKLEHLRSEYKKDSDYWHWYRDNFEKSEHVSRIEMSFKTMIECSGITKRLKEANRSGELVDETELCLDVLGTIYKGNKDDKRSKQYAIKLNDNRGTLEPLMKFFCVKPNNETKHIKRIKDKSEIKMSIEELYKRKLSQIQNEFKHLMSEDEMLEIDIKMNQHTLPEQREVSFMT